MKLLFAAASAALFAFPVVAGPEPMWMLRATLCLQTGKWEAECRKGVWGPYLNSTECRVRGDMMMFGAREQAEADGANVLFLAAYCIQGRDI